MAETVSPLVGIVMGSDSDWPKIQAAADAWTSSAFPMKSG